MPKEFLNFRAKPELIEGLDEVVEYIKANSVPGIRVTKTDAFMYLINSFREQQKQRQKPSRQKTK